MIKFVTYLILSSFVVLSMFGKVYADDFQDIAKKAEQSFHNGDYEQAKVLWSKLSELHPLDIRIQNNLAVIEIRKGEYEKAKYILESSLNNQSRVGVALRNLNQIYAYKAQRAYQKVFKSTEITTPEGSLIGIASLELTSLDLEQEFKEHTQQNAMNERIKGKSKEDKINVVKTEVLSSLEKWRYAWAAQDIETYLGFYQNNFIPANNVSHRDWRNTRKRNVGSPSFIHIDLSNIKISQINADEFKVTFLQKYKSNRLQNTVRKVMKWTEESPGKWKISQERVIR